MSLQETIKKQVIDAMKAKDTLARDVLRVLQGDIEMHHTRTGEHMTDDQAQKVVRKLIKSNQETLAVKPDAAAVEKLNREITILEALLPRTLGIDEIVAALAAVEGGIKAAGNDGQATGVAMKHLKPQGLAVEGKDVSAAVKQIRSA
ncbi:MAG: GatB/YqeY domain-containing protein [Phycisphaeraceae bacterium]|nr:GatB/YqeY domain-containing protein [Phycisphaeraceae bacterium]